MRQTRLAIVIPVYNEAGNIEELLRGLSKVTSTIKDLKCLVMVIDDNSPDKTGELVQHLRPILKSNRFSVDLLKRPKKDGLGNAYIDGFRQILKGSHDYILQMDADFSHNPKYIPGLVKLGKHKDFVVASRYILKNSTPDWKIIRKLLSRSANIYISVLLGNEIMDYTGGYNLYSSKVLRKIDFNQLKSPGYGFLTELKFHVLHNTDNFSILPIVFKDRTVGKSKMPKATIFHGLYIPIYLRYKYGLPKKT